MHAAGAEHLAAHDPQARRRQLEADDEQQHHHAQLGHRHRALDVLDQLEPVRPHHRAGDEVTEHRAEAEAPEQRHGDHRRQQEDQDEFEIALLVHARLLRGLCLWKLPAIP